MNSFLDVLFAALMDAPSSLLSMIFQLPLGLQP